MKVFPIENIELDKLCNSNPKRYPFLLESVNSNDTNRYSILFANPQESIVLNHIKEFDFLQKLSTSVEQSIKANSVDLPFTGGWFVYFSYELIGQIEPVLKKDLFFNNQPIAIATKIPTAIVFDHLKNKSYLLDEENDESRLGLVLEDIKATQEIPKPSFEGELSFEVEEKFLSAVEKTRAYIKAGDVFQVNLSRQWQYHMHNELSSTQIYRALKKANPAPFSALAQFDDFSVISSSPERLFSVDGNLIQTRPIAGTHPRGKGDEDKLLKAQLISHPKEQAEHIMLVDLERNDLGRVCEYGSVVADEIMTLETYEYVHHIVSNIKGRLKPDLNIKHLIKALFPGGTITGCPKVRCMQIIAELEQGCRGSYTGSLGYISNNAKMDFNILIRSISKQNETLTIRAGAGIVFDSIAPRELEETKHKAEGMLKIFKG